MNQSCRVWGEIWRIGWFFFFIYIYIYIYETTLDQINKQHMLASALYIFPKSQLNRGFICENKVCEGAFYESGSSWRLHSALWWSPLSQGSRQETFLCELFFCTAEACHWLEPCSLWEKSQRAEDGIFIFYFVLLHLYSIDICNGWNINVSDVPVNVNKIKPILKGTRLWVVWWRVQCRSRIRDTSEGATLPLRIGSKCQYILWVVSLFNIFVMTKELLMLKCWLLYGASKQNFYIQH